MDYFEREVGQVRRYGKGPFVIAIVECKLVLLYRSTAGQVALTLYFSPSIRLMFVDQRL